MKLYQTFACNSLFLMTLFLLPWSSQAQQARVYSTEGYCILSFEQVNDSYLKQYESRLGFRPKVKLCNRVNRLIVEFQPARWDYQYGQPYPGSSIYLAPDQVNEIRKARQLTKQARR